MAKKARKKSKAKAKKAKAKKTQRARPRTKVRAKAKRPAAKKRAGAPGPKAEPKGFAAKIASAYHTVVDTVRGTDVLRNKMEPRSTSETE